MADMTTSVPFPRRYWPDVVEPARLSIAACLVVACMNVSIALETVISAIYYGETYWSPVGEVYTSPFGAVNSFPVGAADGRIYLSILPGRR